jgi:hypothetical protein
MPRPLDPTKQYALNVSARPHPDWLNSCAQHPQARNCYNVLNRALRNYVKTKVERRLNKSEAYILLGCTIPEWKVHLEKQFHVLYDWHNWCKEWNVFYLEPRWKYDWNIPEERAIVFHYTNTAVRGISEIKQETSVSGKSLPVSDEAAALYGVYTERYREHLAPCKTDEEMAGQRAIWAAEHEARNKLLISAKQNGQI